MIIIIIIIIIINNNPNVECDIFNLIIILEDESVFLLVLFLFKVGLRMPYVVGGKRRLTKIFECLREIITRTVKLN